MVPKLTVDFEVFKKEIRVIKSSLSSIMSSEYPSSKELKNAFDDILLDAHKKISDLFSPAVNYFTFEFLNAEPVKPSNLGRRAGHTARNLGPEKINLDGQAKITALDYIVETIQLCDYLKNPGSFDKTIRKQWGVQQVNSFLLEKLYQAKRDIYFPIELILEGNGFHPKYPGAFQDLIGDLEKEMLIMLSDKSGYKHGKLSFKGSLIVEENRNKNDVFFSTLTEIGKTISNSVEIKKQKENWTEMLKSEHPELVLRKVLERLQRESPLYGKFVSISNQLKELKRHRLKATMTRETLSVETNRIIEILLVLIGAIEDFDLAN